MLSWVFLFPSFRFYPIVKIENSDSKISEKNFRVFRVFGMAVYFGIFFNDWIIYTLFQISFQKRFLLKRNQLTNWHCQSFEWFLFNTNFYWKKRFAWIVFNPLYSIKFVIFFIKVNPVPILFHSLSRRLQKQAPIRCSLK